MKYMAPIAVINKRRKSNNTYHRLPAKSVLCRLCHTPFESHSGLTAHMHEAHRDHINKFFVHKKGEPKLPV